MRIRGVVLAGIALTLVTAGAVRAQTSLTAQDRSDIQELSARYARARPRSMRISSLPTPATSPVISGARSSDAIG